MQKVKKSIKVPLIIISRWMLLCFIALLFSTCKQALPPEEGRKYLGAFDNEMIQLVRRIAKTEGFGALISFAKRSDLPVPFMNKNTTSDYNFNANKGLYYVNSKTGAVEKKAQSNVVELIYPFDSQHDTLAKFILSDYSETPTALQMTFPQKMEMKIMAGEKTLFTTHLSATFEHDFPAKMDVEIIFAAFKIRMLLNTTFRRSHAHLKMEFEIEENGKKKLSTTLTSKVKITGNTLFYNNIDFSLEAFPIQVAYESDLDFSHSDPENFVEIFNKHTKIRITSLEGNQIGSVFLAQLQGRDCLNPMFRYPDGTIENLGDVLLIIQKVLNIKIHNLDGFAGA